MIAETIPEAYDSTGRQVSQPFLKRKEPHPPFPMGRYGSQPLAVQCKTIEDVRRFLRGCRGLSDEELFGKRDYWHGNLRRNSKSAKRVTVRTFRSGPGVNCSQWDSTLASSSGDTDVTASGMHGSCSSGTASAFSWNRKPGLLGFICRAFLLCTMSLNSPSHGMATP